MLGTIVNTACIILGSVAGSYMKRGIKEEYQTALYNALGVCTILLGANAFVQNLPKSSIPVLFIASMAIGSVIGYRFDLDGKFDRLVNRFKKNPSTTGETSHGRLSEGLSTGILLYCIGTFSMLGPVLSALHGDNTYLYTNATLDLISSAVLASTYGIGMVWAAPVLFCWQGMFYAMAKCSESIITGDVVCELSIVGGILITSSGLNILNIKSMKTLNMLPAFLVPPIFFLLKYALLAFFQ